MGPLAVCDRGFIDDLYRVLSVSEGVSSVRECLETDGRQHSYAGIPDSSQTDQPSSMQGDFHRPDQSWARNMDSGPSWGNGGVQPHQTQKYPPAPTSANGSDAKMNGNISGSGDSKGQPPPKRGAKACTACAYPLLGPCYGLGSMSSGLH